MLKPEFLVDFVDSTGFDAASTTTVSTTASTLAATDSTVFTVVAVEMVVETELRRVVLPRFWFLLFLVLEGFFRGS
jgi:hypothetical protein